MTKIKTAETATQDLERAFKLYSETAKQLLDAEAKETKCSADYETAIAEFDDTERGKRRVREASDELAMAKATAGRLRRAAKEASLNLISPSRIARDAVGEAVKEARDKNSQALFDALCPFYEDEVETRRAIAGISVQTKVRKALAGRPGNLFAPEAPMEVFAGMVLRECQLTLRAIASN